MAETKKVAPDEQPSGTNNSSVDSIIPQSATECLSTVAAMFDGESVFLKLRGYSSSNKEDADRKRYSAAKVPIDKDWTNSAFEGHSLSDLAAWIDRGGWIGMRIPADYIVVDVDDVAQGRIIGDLLKNQKINHHLLRTPNGYQFFFKDSGVIQKQNAKMFTECGFEVDYRLQHRGQIVIPTPNTEGRKWLHIERNELDDMPFWFTPVKQITAKNTRPFSVPIDEGARNTTLFQHACRLKKMARSKEDAARAIEFIGLYLCVPSVERDELETLLDSAYEYQDQVIDLRTRSERNNVIELPSGKTRDAAPFQTTFRPKFNYTDLGNAKRLVHYYGRDLRYCYAFGSWYVWDGKRWSKDETGAIERKAKATVMNIYQEALQEEDEKRVSLMKHASSSESRQKISNMISLAQSEEGIPVTPAQLDEDQWKLNCLNGVIDLKNGVLLSHSRDDLITNMVEAEYDPNADCPTWKKFLNRIMQDDHGNVREELIHFLQKAVGYALTGSIKEQVMFFLHGSGKNGKSTFINVVKDLLGDYSRQTGTETFMTKQNSGGVPNDLARLKGARLISAVESEEGKRLAESLIKQLTGGEPITARFLHKEFFEFTPTFKIFFVTNHKPQIRGTDPAIWRRIRLIPFTVTIPPEEDDKTLPDKLRNEMPGILRWAVEGCLKWQEEGLGAPDAVMNATAEYKEEMDTLSQFVEDYCVVHPTARVATKDLYKTYQDWCEESGEYCLAKNKFINKLKERMESHGSPITEFRTNQARGYVGIGLASDSNLFYPSDKVTQSDDKKSNHMNDTADKKNSELNVTSVTVSQKAWEEGEL